MLNFVDKNYNLSCLIAFKYSKDVEIVCEEILFPITVMISYFSTYYQVIRYYIRLLIRTLTFIPCS